MIGQDREIRIGGLARMAFVLSLGLLCLLFFLFIQPYHLLYDEQMQLFLFTSDYFISYFGKPAWLACYTGDFLTQFYYLKGGGAVVLSLVLGLELLLLLGVFSRFGKRDNWLYAVLPVLMDWYLHTGISYRLSSSIALIIALFVFLLYSFLRNRKLAFFSGLLMTPLLYNLIGGHFITFILLVILYDISKFRYLSFPYWLLLAGIGTGLPLLVREYFLLTTGQAYFYPAGSAGLFYPVFLLSGLLIFYLISLRNNSFRYQRKELTVLFIMVVLLIVNIFANAGYNREKILCLDSETYFGNWEKVSEKAGSYEMKTPLTSYFMNVAWMKQGVLPDKLMSGYQPFVEGMFIPVGPQSTPLEILFSGEIYFQLGDMNMAQHSTMLAMIFSPQKRSSRLVKRLTEINLIIGDTAAADKYLRILDKTLFYRRYASNMRQAMREGEGNAWLAGKRSNIAAYDTLRVASDAVASLTMLLESNPGNKEALDYLLCYHLLNKNIPAFMTVYDKWYKGKEYALPRLYAEALLIGLARQKIPAKVLATYAIPDELTTAFLDYTKKYQEAEGDGTGLQESYKDTYWFYYHYAQMKEE